MAGYDISASVSESKTLASRAGEGDFTVISGGSGGGGISTVLAVAAIVGVVLLWFVFRKGSK